MNESELMRDCYDPKNKHSIDAYSYISYSKVVEISIKCNWFGKIGCLPQYTLYSYVQYVFCEFCSEISYLVHKLKPNKQNNLPRLSDLNLIGPEIQEIKFISRVPQPNNFVEITLMRSGTA